jgi:hypothetical protein
MKYVGNRRDEKWIYNFTGKSVLQTPLLRFNSDWKDQINVKFGNGPFCLTIGRSEGLL